MENELDHTFIDDDPQPIRIKPMMIKENPEENLLDLGDDQLLMESIETFGLVPLVFYGPLLNDTEKLLITKNGGLLTSIVECFTI